ncbi:MAG: glycosyltransferase family 2 protein [Phycisphaerales bacterium]|nr:glycosyltransferase family 2 protein [Phycisphaerales bacterium]
MKPVGAAATSHPEVSVVLCTHNGEPWLEEQLQSIATQTRPPDELVVGDDASRDGTWGILQSFARSADFPVHIARHDPALGVIENFEVTLSRSKGRYVALSDQDDVWLPDRLQRGVEAIRAVEGDGDRPVLSHSDLLLVDADGQETGERFMAVRGIDGTPANMLGVLLRHNLATGCTVTCNRALVDQAMPFPDHLVMHDWWLALVAASLGEVTFLETPTVRYRQHGSNQVGAPPLVGREGLRRVLPGRSTRQALADVFRQDLELGRRFESSLPAEVQDFIAAIPAGGYRLWRAASRAGVRPQGLLRRIRFFLETFGGGYRRYL